MVNVLQSPFSSMWKLRCVLSLPYLLAATAFVLPSGPTCSNDGSPLQAAFHAQPESPIPGSNLEWNFPPNPNSTHHLIFNSVSGLLHRWPNTLRRNGAAVYTSRDFNRSHKAAFQVIVSSLRQYPLGQSYITGAPTLKSHIHPTGLRSTLNTPTCFAKNLAT